MNIAKVFSLICLAGLAANAQAADTPLKLGKDATVIQGQLKNRAKLDALVNYIPAYKLDAKKSSKGCTFAEDQYSPNDGDKFVTALATQNQGQYTLSIPTKGMRGGCEYALNTLTLDLEGGKVSQSIILRTKAFDDALNKSLVDAGLDPQVTTPFANVKQILCDFNTSYDNGFCDLGNGDLIEVQYEIPNTPAAYTMDIRTK
jgi:hypothetical protein